MLIISKVFTILCLLCLCGNREYPGSFQNKAVRSYFELETEGETEGERKAFFGGCKKGDHILRLSPSALDCHER